MTHVRKKKGAKKMRKKIFRRMKRLAKTVENHARNYHQFLKSRWQETNWSELESKAVLDRLQNILGQLPQAVHQAHERLIDERRVANKDKILSLYEPDIHVLLRGKADAEVEFGNGLYLAEQIDELIVDWQFIEGQPPGDSTWFATASNGSQNVTAHPKATPATAASTVRPAVPASKRSTSSMPSVPALCRDLKNGLRMTISAGYRSGEDAP